MTTRPLPGLCSVTFRALPPSRIVDLAAGAGVLAIEWGADVHVPPGDIDAAHEVRHLTDSGGLITASYGSYLRAGRLADDPDSVARTLDTAAELGAPNVRVWAAGSAAADDLGAICAAAAERSLTVSIEFHPGTATETAAGTAALLHAAGAPNLFTYWQPDPSLDLPTLLGELDAVAEWLSHLHVFWWRADRSRRPLAEGASLWLAAFDHIGGRWDSDRTRIAFLEFVRDDEPDQFRADAATLQDWLAS